MKKLYWRPRKISTFVLVMVALVSIAALVVVENNTVSRERVYYKDKVAAARLASVAFDAIKAERLKAGHPINYEYDPAGTGMLGEANSPVTTNPGYITSKRSAANPNFAAVALYLLKKAGLQRGDTVAIGMTGSFPGMNIAVLAAVQVMGLKPIIITSVGSSQWGANFTDFMWPDMERMLNERNIIHFQSEAMTRGGIDDNALGLDEQAISLIDASIERGGRPALEVRNYRDSYDRRMEIYTSMAGDKPIAAYINIGGGTVSVGRSVGKKIFSTGLNTDVHTGVTSSDESIMLSFAQRRVPVIHFSKFNGMAGKYQLPVNPQTAQKAGIGPVFVSQSYNKYLAGAFMLVILLLMFAFVRMDWGYRLFKSGGSPSSARDSAPEQSV